jgi:hypothetical protein
MSTLAEIEAAMERLPQEEQAQLFRVLAKRFGAASCYDLARDLLEAPGGIGASGIADLSTNKTHLAGFGSKTRRIEES